MNYYQQGTLAPVAIVPRRYVARYRDARQGSSMLAHGLTRGRGLASAYSIGTGRVSVSGDGKVSNAIVDFMLTITHIVLIGAGLWLLINAVMSL